MKHVLLWAKVMHAEWPAAKVWLPATLCRCMLMHILHTKNKSSYANNYVTQLFNVLKSLELSCVYNFEDDWSKSELAKDGIIKYLVCRLY